ncbi:hypothetical protein CFBP5877_03785 [Agrobacterium tumefaciens]|uniref:Uncharacterized protein n=1 Tax=Agrobacterium tumefaciens TaxID=358 RepID=A0AAE6BA78_AGRTU|nr:hypothetical protein [Agrobacterium tumefaciens]QCL78285.1 hypothetical protein CFBP5877_03785 [Agrobacterium tumefaciens]CUX15354.1 hypothetical protein AGR6A_Cc100021 [Agrobacterium sp. NCPPB 925]
MSLDWKELDKEQKNLMREFRDDEVPIRMLEPHLTRFAQRLRGDGYIVETRPNLYSLSEFGRKFMASR